MVSRFLLITLALCVSLCATTPWKAHWLTVPGVSPHDYGVYHFRRSFELGEKPASFVIHVSGDNRYQLFVNGQRVAVGPARGDLFHWRYETVDIAPQLKTGKNALAAVVWNDGPYKAVAQISSATAFILEGDERVNTGADWRCAVDKAYTAHPLANDQRTGYFALGPGEEFDAARYPWGWEHTDFDDSQWLKPLVLARGEPRASQDAQSKWFLVPREIPFEEQTPEKPLRVRSGEAVRTYPAHTSATAILDQGYLTTAYPELVVSGGRGARVALKYAEGLWLPGKNEKGDRDVIDGKRFLGSEDVFEADGGSHRLYRPLYWRTYRYLQVTVQTADEPVAIEQLRGVFTGYPFERKAQFQGGGEEIGRILDTGWRTARLCAHETYMDCPYYEQLQYVGDTRIQGLVSLYMTGDARLLRNALEQVNSSRTSEGLTYSRAPSDLPQYIPGFSLWWIGMLHDYWMYVDDPAFVKSMLPGVRSVLSYFEAAQKPNGRLGPVHWWPYFDWTPQWQGGVPPAGGDGDSAPYDLQLMLAYQWASELESALGNAAIGVQDREAARRLRNVIRDSYLDAGRGLLADTPAKQSFSQQTNALAIIGGVFEGAQTQQAMERMLSDASLVQASTYFRAYVNEALTRAGLGDRYLEMLGPWKTMLGMHLTTWAEALTFDRSDCHAWGASPNYELFRTVLGVSSAAPGFKRVRIAPNLNGLPEVSGSVPSPRGPIAVHVSAHKATIDLPAQLEGEFVWQGQTRKLNAGHTEITF
ncbi:MAG TPA: alpha-L-rhamnosidase N-terminal domain-containing protein [Bryobacteraceae bacterium]|nr:alpha-L-rhamnosidase N-terminal domain-containing protein [Bryobacteraceae bacterium]